MFQIPVTDPQVAGGASQLVDLLKGFAQFSSQATVSGFIVMAIQWLKGSKYFPWISQQTQRINQLLSVGAALITSVGINHAWNPNTRILSFAIPTLAVFLAAISHAAHGILLNEGIYRAFVKRVTDAETAVAHAVTSGNKAPSGDPPPSGGIPNPFRGKI
jgi:hypothetical protein